MLGFARRLFLDNTAGWANAREKNLLENKPLLSRGFVQ